jgi:hypothetical protein
MNYQASVVEKAKLFANFADVFPYNVQWGKHLHKDGSIVQHIGGDRKGPNLEFWLPLCGQKGATLTRTGPNVVRVKTACLACMREVLRDPDMVRAAKFRDSLHKLHSVGAV